MCNSFTSFSRFFLSDPSPTKSRIELHIDDIVLFTGNVPYSEVNDYIKIADICLCPIPPIPLYSLSSPTKLFEYMAMRKPIIANKEIIESSNALENSKGGILVNFNEEEFYSAMKKLLENSELRSEIGNRGYDWLSKNRSYEKMAINILEIYNNM
jgi:glycosyltransferase involved in cell wall biosynthesis